MQHRTIRIGQLEWRDIDTCKGSSRRYPLHLRRADLPLIASYIRETWEGTNQLYLEITDNDGARCYCVCNKD